MQGILLALRTRETAGVGQKVEVTMYDSMLHLQMQEACMQLNRGYEVNWGAMPLSGVFETTDGAVCMVGGFNPDPLPRISEALGLDEDLTLRPEFATLDSSSSTSRRCRRSSASASPPTPPSTGPPGWRTRDSSTPPCTPWSRPWTTRRPQPTT